MSKVTSAVYSRLRGAGIVLPVPPRPVANFATHVQEGSLLFLSGQGPQTETGGLRTGKVGAGVTVEESLRRCAPGRHKSARGFALRAWRPWQGEARDQVAGMVNAAPDFTDHPHVIDGCSDLFVEIFRDAGHHARSAVGLGSLPRGT